MSLKNFAQIGRVKDFFGRLRRHILFRFADFGQLLVVLFAGLLLLSGRYDWAPAVRQFSLRGYLSSAYLFLITIPTIYFLLKNFFPQHKKWVWGLTLGCAAWFSLPYRWLKLDQFYYNRERPVFYNISDFPSYWAQPWTPDLKTPQPDNPLPITNWLPGAWTRLNDMPFEALFFLILFVAGLLTLFVCLKIIKKQAQDRPQTRRRIWLAFGLFLLILLQTYLHLSLRSPYVYISHFSRPPEQTQLYVNFMFPNYQGAVNADMEVFRGLEDHFFGTPRVTPTSDIRRAYTFYISSQLSYFIGTYYAFLVLNILLWFTSCICAYLLGRTWWKHEVGIYMAFLVGCGPGFIMFVAQPMQYVSGYAAVIILICLFERLLLEDPKPLLGHFLLFGCLVGLGSLVYDFFAWYVFFLLYGLMRRCSLKGLISSLGVGLAIYLGFMWIQTSILHLAMDTSNNKYLGESIQNIYHLIAQKHIGGIYTLTVGFFGTYLNHLAHVFFVVPLILALCGIFFIRSHPYIRIFSFLLLLPTLISFAFLYYGGTTFGGYLMSSFSRFYFPAYPAVYLLAAGMLSEGREYLSQKGWSWLGSLSVWGILGFMFVLSNIDSFGFLPQLYYLIYFTSGGYFK